MKAVTVTLPNGSQVLVRLWGNGNVEADVRGPGLYDRSWVPVAVVGGSFTVEEVEE